MVGTARLAQRPRGLYDDSMNADEDPIPPFDLLSSTPGEDLGIFRVRTDQVRNPRNGHEMAATVLEAPSWVNVVAMDPRGAFLFVRQWRFGVREATLEIPGGIVDPGEEPQETAVRELLEETGHRGEAVRSLGSSTANPAFLDNRCHHFLVTGAVRVAPPRPDAGEQLEVLRLDRDELVRRVHAGEIHHSLVLAALCRVVDLTQLAL